MCPPIVSFMILCRGLTCEWAPCLQVKLRSSDNEVFTVPENVAIQSVTVKELIEGERTPLFAGVLPLTLLPQVCVEFLGVYLYFAAVVKSPC